MTCIHEHKGVPLSEAEARIHQDNNPNHVIDVSALDEVASE